jgi:hypothetical protein
MPISEVSFKIAIWAFVVALVPLGCAIFYTQLGSTFAAELAFVIVIAAGAVAAVSLAVGIIAKFREQAPPR